MGEVFYNSEFINEEEIVIKISNRAFNYGDGFFETIKIINSKPFNFSAHFLRCCLACKILKFEFNTSEDNFIELVLKLIEKNNIKNGSIKIHISRGGDVKYLPSSLSTNILITAENGNQFHQNSSISLCVFNEEVKTKGKLSNIKSSNALVSILAAIYANENRFDNALLLNTDENVIETTNSNIFILKSNKFYTPPITDGCVDGTMRKWILQEEKVIEKSLLISDINQADEVFLSNATKGITPVRIVSSNETIEYKTTTAKKLQEKLINLSSGL